MNALGFGSESIQSLGTVVQRNPSMSPKFAMISDFAVTYTEAGRWNKVDLSMQEFLNLLISGTLDEKPICAIQVLSVTDGEESAIFIYDFILLAMGHNPWRMI